MIGLNLDVRPNSALWSREAACVGASQGGAVLPPPDIATDLHGFPVRCLTAQPHFSSCDLYSVGTSEVKALTKTSDSVRTSLRTSDLRTNSLRTETPLFSWYLAW